jgi:AcrR family transcriptional regulator
MGARDRDGTGSRRAIIDAALELFGRLGYDGASMKAIAGEAGISPGLIYHYFDGKEQLLQAIFAECMEDVQRSFAEAELASTPGDRIGALVHAAFGIVRRNLSFWRLSYGSRMQAAVLAALGPRVGAWRDEIHATLAGYFRAAGAGQPELEATLLFALIDGVAQHYVLDPEHYPLDAMAAHITAAYARSPAGALFTGAS